MEIEKIKLTDNSSVRLYRVWYKLLGSERKWK